MAEQESKERAVPAAAIAHLISVLTGKTSDVLDAVREIERMGAGEIAADFAERGTLEALQRTALIVNEQITEIERSLRDLTERARTEYEYWTQNRRFRPDVVEATLAGLHDHAKQDPAAAATAWAAQVVEALTRHEYTAAVQLAEGYSDADAKYARTLRDIAGDIRLWAAGDATAAVRVSGRIREAFDERMRLPAETQAQRALLAAVAEQQAGHGDDAIRTMDAALQVLSLPTVLEAERAGLSLVLGQVGDATQRAHRAVELAPADPDGYFHLGACSEQGGDLAEASALYEEGCARSTLLKLHLVGKGATFLRATGLLHLQRARRLAEMSHTEEALQAVGDALREGVAGDVLYPDAPAYELRAELLGRMGDNEGAAAAAFRAGQQHLWNGDAERALPLLERASKIKPPIPGVGWHYADALCAMSWPSGAPLPDTGRAEHAKRVWDGQVRRFGLPTADNAWAYGTRAQLSELLAERADGDRAAAAWEALVYVEKAMVLDKTIAGMWALSAHFLRALSMDSAALESADYGFTLDPDSRIVLERRLGLLANTGRYADAEQTLNRIPGRDSDPYLVGVHAWLLYHRGRYLEAVKALDLPLAAGNDPGWYLELRVSCLVRLQKPAAACRDLERLLEVEAHKGSVSARRRAMALTELGRFGEAAAELEHIKPGDRTTTADIEEVWVALHLARGDLAAAKSAAERYLGSVMEARKADDALGNWRECLELLAQQGADVAAATHLVEELAAWRAARPQSAQRSDANAEIEHAIVQHGADPPGSHPRIALTAMTARRLLSGDAGDFERAEALLRGLERTLFEPEAGIAVTAALHQRLTRAVSDGDEIQARHIYDELAGRGGAPSSPVEMVVAEALAATGRYGQAVSSLAAARVRLLGEDRAVLPVEERISEYALRTGDTETSLAALSRALEIAQKAGNRLSEAQVRARMATAFALRGDADSVAGQLSRALQALRQEGAAAPSSTLGHELAAVAETTGAASVMGLLSESLGRAVEQVDPTDRAGHELLDSVAARSAR